MVAAVSEGDAEPAGLELAPPPVGVGAPPDRGHPGRGDLRHVRQTARGGMDRRLGARISGVAAPAGEQGGGGAARLDAVATGLGDANAGGGIVT